MLLHTWLRQLWLRRALRGYPLYDPPHKIEEYLLSREQAMENFDYFMRVRIERVEYFKNWLRLNFRVTVTQDEAGMRALNKWGNRYAGLLLTIDANGRVKDSYFTYDPPWVGENAVYNALFDTGITLGEIMIANCPKLHWVIDPISSALPRTGKMLKKTPGMSFQRPKIAGFENPRGYKSPLHRVWGFSHQMMLYTRTWSGMKRYYRQPRFFREKIRWELLNIFRGTLNSYYAPDPDRRPKQMSEDEYLRLVDEMESGEGED
jgi:hypothetical protein